MLLAAAAIVAAAACTTNEQATPAKDAELPALPHDTHSFAQPEKARVTNVSLDITPDFAAKRINGIARLTIQRAANADSVMLDIRDIDIKRVNDSKGDSLGFTIGATKEFLGHPSQSRCLQLAIQS